MKSLSFTLALAVTAAIAWIAFSSLVLAQDETQAPSGKPAIVSSKAYPVTICVVCSKPLGAPETTVDHAVGGRTFKLCCKDCAKQLTDSPKAAADKLDAAITKAQSKTYPLEVCVISGEKLGSMGTPVDFVFNDRLYRLCCNACAPKIKKDPTAATDKLNAAVVEKQAGDYKPTTCPVRGSELGATAVYYIYNNHLIELCCKNCVRKMDADPSGYIAKMKETSKK